MKTMFQMFLNGNVQNSKNINMFLLKLLLLW